MSTQKRLPPLFRTASRRSPEEKGRAGSISSTRNRRGAELRTGSEGYLGSARNRRLAGELSHFPDGGMARQKKTIREQRLGKAGKAFRTARSRGIRSRSS